MRGCPKKKERSGHKPTHPIFEERRPFRGGSRIPPLPFWQLWYHACVMHADDKVSGKKILIVEDDPLLHNLLADKLQQLRDRGAEVFPVMNAEEGLKTAKEVHPDLILLDLVLPKMTGFEFLELLRKEAGFEKTPVVILSNLNAEADKERAKALGAIAYFVKANFSLSEISGAVEELLMGHAVPPSKDTTPGIQKVAGGGYMIYL